MTYLGMWVTGNSNNYGLWSDADYDAIIDECTTGDLCTDPEGRWAALYEAEQIVLEQAVIFPLYGQCTRDDLLCRQGCRASPLRSEPCVQEHHQERVNN